MERTRTAQVIRTLATAAMVAALSAGSALAASDGLLGLNSTGTSLLSITKGDQAQITGIADIAMPAWTTGSPAPAGSTTACVFTTTGAYQVTTSSANTTGTNYRLFDGALNYIVYTVQWNDGGGAVAMTGSTTLTSQTGSTILGCGGTNATVAVDITNPVMIAAPVGVYADTLTVLIAPE